MDYDSDAPDREPVMLNYWSDEDDLCNDEGNHEILMNQTRNIAAVALESYNKKEGVQYVLDQPLTSFCFLLNGVLVCHANFTAKKEKLDDATNASSGSSDSSLANSTPEKEKLDVVVDDGNASGSSSDSSLASPTTPTTPVSELFFAETAHVGGRNVKVTCCDILNPSAEPDGVRDGCLYCESRNPIFYHPRGSTWKYGYQTAFKRR